MNSIKKGLMLLAILCAFAGSRLSAQGVQQRNAAAFEKVCSLIDKQDATALFALTTKAFQEKITWVNFENYARFGLFSQGKVTSSSLLGFADNVSTYKTSFPGGDFKITISTDDDGKIAGLMFKKMESEAAQAEKKGIIKSSNPLETEIDRAIDVAASAYMKQAGTVGMCIGVLEGGIMRSYSYGETERGSGELPGVRSAFEIGSITKTFTAALLASFANAGTVSLNDPITKYLPDSVKKNKNLEGITLQMLANHTSGLARVPDNLLSGDADAANPYKNYDKKKLFSYLKRCKPESKPGTVCSYSNTGAGLLGTLLEKVSGKPYEDMLEEILLDPMKLESTCIHPKTTGEHAGHGGQLLLVYDEKGQPTPHWKFDALAGAGAIRSTSIDLLEYAQYHIDLNTSPLGRALALTHVTTFDKDEIVGLGWFQKKTPKHTIFWHNGGTFGSSSFMAFVPGKRIALVVLSNCGRSVDETAGKILNTLMKD